MAIRKQATDEIDQEIDRAAMTRMFNLRNVLELVDNGFHDGPFAKQEFVHEWHQHIFHIGTDPCNQLDIEGAQKFFKQLFGNIAFIGKEFAKELPNHAWHRFSVVHVARREHEIEQCALIIENQV